MKTAKLALLILSIILTSYIAYMLYNIVKSNMDKKDKNKKKDDDNVFSLVFTKYIIPSVLVLFLVTLILLDIHMIKKYKSQP